MAKNPETAFTKLLVLSITRMTVHNGPGIRTLILFKGCPLRCLWCSTPESQKAEPEIALYPGKCTHCDQCLPVCPTNAIHLTDETMTIDRTLCDGCGKCTEVCYQEAIKLLGREMSIQEMLEEVEKDVIAYRHSGGGVTISGGEPLLSSDFALELFQAFKEVSINIGVDTCGYVPWTNIEQVLPYINFFLWDIKHMDDQKHRQFTGVSNKLILSNICSVSERGVPLYIRVPVIAGYNDSEKNIRAVCEFTRNLSSLIEINLLPLHHLGKTRYASLDRDYPIEDITLIPDGVLRDMKRLVESYGLVCVIVS